MVAPAIHSFLSFEPVREKTNNLGSDTNQAVQSQKMVRGWKFWILKVEELYYPCSENKGADQLRGYCEADLRICFRLCRLLVFPCGGSFESDSHLEYHFNIFLYGKTE